ncbi:MAG TPA: class I SAM-dependent methyltransferase [Chitinophagaceae bacterium]|nr:class I SAM-dependent methyltransferase [Chitinophagaceae bacterium]
MQQVLDKSYGREAFGNNPAGYHAARPLYPAWVFETLRERCGLHTNTRVFEIGAGTGIATRCLLDAGANPLVAIEPDKRLAAFLRDTIKDEALQINTLPFEDAPLPESSFSLGFCATAFHWLEEDAALAKIARLLRPGGWWAACWNVFGYPGIPDAFHEATKNLFDTPVSQDLGTRPLPFGLDAQARITALEKTGCFTAVEYFSAKWQLVLTAQQTTALYASYSNVNARTDKTQLLDAINTIARDQFENRVIRNMATSLYIAKRL